MRFGFVMPFAYDRRHYQVNATDFLVPDPPVQQPRVPVWVVGGYRSGWERQPSVDRAALWDGILPYWIDAESPGPVRNAAVGSDHSDGLVAGGACDLTRSEPDRAELRRRIRAGPPSRG